MSAPRRTPGGRPGPRSRNRPADAPTGARRERPAGSPGPARTAPKTAKTAKATKAAKAATATAAQTPAERRRRGNPDPEPAAQERARRSERRTRLTGRAAVLTLVIAALSLSLAYPVRQYFGQRAEMADLRDQVRQQEQRVAELQAERDRWSDPAYIKAQARDRLHYCMPDETCYVTVDPAAPSRP